MKSIISNERKCYITGRVSASLDKHHIFNGPCRDWSEKEGLWVYLTHEIHMTLHHEDHSLMIELKRIGQYYYELTHTRDEFMKHTHRNYLYEPLSDYEKDKYKIKEIKSKEIFDIGKDVLPWNA